MTKRLKGVHLAAATAAYCIAHAAVAPAQESELPFDPVLTIGNTALVNDSVVANQDGSFLVAGTQSGGSLNGLPTWSLAWELALDQDPFIAGTVTLTNLTGTTRNYNLEFTLPILPSFSPSEYRGSVSALVTDLNGDRVAAIAPIAISPAIYRGTIDGTAVLPLLGLSVSCSGGSPGCTASAADSLGEPGAMIPGPAVNSTIGIFLNFSLSAGDRVTFLTNFTVEPPSAVPLPGALPLLLGGLGLLGVSRRRKTKA